MSTESEKVIEVFLTSTGLIPSDLGVDRDEAWAKFFHDGTHHTITAGYGVNSTEESVAEEIRREVRRRGIGFPSGSSD